MKITACPLCGSTNVGTGGISDGVHPQEFLKQACKNCGWTGTPLEFDTEKDYQQFLDEINKEKETYYKISYEDPAKSAPFRRYVIRSFWTVSLYLLILVIPGIVFFIISELAGFPSNIGVLFAFLSFFGYIYFLCKKELWNKIQR